MAETASILAPDKIVILPDPHAGCPLANSITPADILKLKEKYKDHVVVSYINTTAEVKALSDYICTSANAVSVVDKISEDKIIFVPDRNLGYYVSKHTKKEMIIWDGFCPTHQRILPQNILELKEKHKDAKIVVHPECRKEVLDLADKVASTSGIIKYVKEDNHHRYIIGTEAGLLHRLRKEVPNKEFFLASPLAVCANMKKIHIRKNIMVFGRFISTSKGTRSYKRKSINTNHENAILMIDRYIANFKSKSTLEKFDIIIVGSGIAGLISAYYTPPQFKVGLFTKDKIEESNTYYAQGGIAVALAPDDSPELHFKDTILAGADFNEEK